jgi:hypothetical protein
MEQHISRLRLQFLLDFCDGPRFRAARIKKRDSPTPAKVYGVPAEEFHQHIARLGGRRPREERRHNLLERKFIRPGQDEAGGPLLKEQLL